SSGCRTRSRTSSTSTETRSSSARPPDLGRCAPPAVATPAPSDHEGPALTTTEALADFVTSLRYEDLPSEVVERAKHLAVHSWGIQLASSTLPWSKLVY